MVKGKGRYCLNCSKLENLKRNCLKFDKVGRKGKGRGGEDRIKENYRFQSGKTDAGETKPF